MLTDKQIIGIRAMQNRGFASRSVAVKFDCSHVTVCRVWRGETRTYQERLEHRYWSKVKKTGLNNCWNWLGGLDNGGYGVFNHPLLTRSAHRFAIILDGRNPKRKVVRHSCNNPQCVNPRHLLLGTHADNVADRVAQDRSATGVKNGRAKLNPSKVQVIRKSKESIILLARRYKVDCKTIKKVKLRQTWKHVI